jgi:putative ABC transport system permease protein
MRRQLADLRLAWRVALREMRSGLHGFRIFLACIVLGVGAIAVIGSLSAALERGIGNEGQRLLGGDIQFSIVHREMEEAKLAFLEDRGTVSTVATGRSMARSGEGVLLVEVKAIDELYPLYGTLELEGGGALAEALAAEDGRFGVVVEPLILSRFGIEPGDTLTVGEATLEVRGEIAREPDRAADGFILGPRVMMTRAALDATGIVRPGSLITWHYRVQLAPGAGAGDVQALRVAATEAYPDAGWSIRTRDRAAPGIDRFLDRLTFLLTLVGLTALIVGGLGIANAVSAFLERKRSTIAILKCLGASSALVFRVYLIEVLVIATAGIVLALALGAAAPFVIEGVFAEVLPVPIAAGLDAGALGIALAFGYLVTVAFALWPLALARTVAPTALFRMAAVSGRPVPERRFLAVIALCLALLGALALLVLDNRNLTAWYLFGLAASFVLLSGLAAALMWAAAKWVRPRGAVLRYAVANLYRPGAATGSILVSLGLGLSLFVTLALMDRNISAELQSSVPEQAPSFFFLDVQSSELDEMLALLDEQPGLQAVETAPMLRGRVQQLDGVPVSQVRPDPEVAWAVRGDRGFTYAQDLPQGSTLAAGDWWPADYDGPPLVSFAEEIARGLGLEIGDTVTVNVLGRDITATLANLRHVDWRSLQMNFAMVFSPNTLSGAPHANIVTVSTEAATESAMLTAVADAFPTVTAVRVRDVLAAVDDLMAKLIVGVRAASAVTFVTGILVLAGALAAGLGGRLYDAAVLKALGATRRQLVSAFAIEYALLGLIAAIFAVAAGSIAAWALVYFLIEIPWSFSAATALLTAVGAVFAAVTAGLLTTWRALHAKPAQLLRTE